MRHSCSLAFMHLRVFVCLSQKICEFKVQHVPCTLLSSLVSNKYVVSLFNIIFLLSAFIMDREISVILINQNKCVCVNCEGKFH